MYVCMYVRMYVDMTYMVDVMYGIHIMYMLIHITLNMYGIYIHHAIYIYTYIHLDQVKRTQPCDLNDQAVLELGLMCQVYIYTCIVHV